MKATDIISEKRSDILRLSKLYGARNVRVFGSVARGEEEADSDIDILVEFEKGKKTFDNYMDLKFFLEDLFKCKVDLVIADALKPDLKPIILGSVIYASEA
ncbi:MAG: nucleotidyltransferase family protein [Candidatus Asgardarchaeia archaeon]